MLISVNIHDKKFQMLSKGLNKPLETVLAIILRVWTFQRKLCQTDNNTKMRIDVFDLFFSTPNLFKNMHKVGWDDEVNGEVHLTGLNEHQTNIVGRDDVNMRKSAKIRRANEVKKHLS